MPFLILYKGKPAGVSFQSRESAKEYVAQHKEELRKHLTIKCVRKTA